MANHPNRKQVPIHYRQGDVLAIAVKSIPADARETKRDEHDRIVLAYGEVTGHAHAFRGKGICGFTKLDSDEVEYLLIESGGGGKTLNHEHADGRQAEHAPHTWPDGCYELADQVSYTPTELIRESD
jgi:hypothetical protein